LCSSKNSPIRLPALCLAALFLCGGCGYGLSSDMPTVIGDSRSTLKISSVEQPTLYPWVVYTVRSSIRDEITARNLATWVEGGESDYSMHIKVNSFTMRGAVTTRADQPLLYTGSVRITVSIYKESDNSESWRATIDYSDTFENETEEEAARLLFIQASRRLADRMRNTF
jgi:hypothetical protein